MLPGTLIMNYVVLYSVTVVVDIWNVEKYFWSNPSKRTDCPVFLCHLVDGSICILAFLVSMTVCSVAVFLFALTSCLFCYRYQKHGVMRLVAMVTACSITCLIWVARCRGSACTRCLTLITQFLSHRATWRSTSRNESIAWVVSVCHFG